MWISRAVRKCRWWNGLITVRQRAWRGERREILKYVKKLCYTLFMAKEKDVKTNVMRILDKNKVSYEAFSYEVEEFVDGIHCADAIGAPHDQSFKTLAAQGKSKE